MLIRLAQRMRDWHPMVVPALPPQANAKCPSCGRPVVVGEDTMLGGMLGGPMFALRPPQELRAACAVHGRAPFNRRTLDWLHRNEQEGDVRSDE